MSCFFNAMWLYILRIGNRDDLLDDAQPLERTMVDSWIYSIGINRTMVDSYRYYSGFWKTLCPMWIQGTQTSMESRACQLLTEHIVWLS